MASPRSLPARPSPFEQNWTTGKENNSLPLPASIPRKKFPTTGTEGSCNTCCAKCSRPFRVAVFNWLVMGGRGRKLPPSARYLQNRYGRRSHGANFGEIGTVILFCQISL